MTIGTAKPTPEELAAAPHYFINTLSIHDNYTAGMYERDALLILEDVFKKHDTVILVGGSTLYVSALLNGIDEIPPVSPEVKDEVNTLFESEGIEGLQKKVQVLDPVYFANSDSANHRRLVRALEVSISSGKPYSGFLHHAPKPRPFEIIKAAIDIPREELYSRINVRCDAMLEAGLLEEVKSLYEYRDLVPLHTVGYNEFFDYLDGKTTYEEAVTFFKQHTRNYAKRQLTWFRKEKDVKWGSVEELREL